MTEKRSFPDNWSDLSDEQVLSNIQYLQHFCQDYEIKRIDKNSISIENVLLTKAKFGKKDTFCVNSKFYQCDIYPYGKMYDYLNDLFDTCEQEMETRDMLKKLEKKKDKKRNRRLWWNNNGTQIIFCALTVIVWSCVGFVCIKKDKKQQEIDKKVEQYEKTLPNYKEYQEYQQQIANYRDSLTNAKTK